ncbi:hypothetical protein PHYBOEH_003530 [Phytophthora boehmeriae]|uniref:Uncharacterized protein n=1 Tax=Phytophthora boehmeriae TaxID=109152 RepID=A0A8T1X990_9STRA|nr:hypothetical protein PHYBOEH_003530 [Phytophthora boehmeriae]
MDGMRRSRAREEDSSASGGYLMDFSSSFHRVKRPRSTSNQPESAIASEEEKEHEVFIDDSDGLSKLIDMTASSTVDAASSWRLPPSQSLEDIQEYLNEQLQHVVALSVALGPRGNAPDNGTRRVLSRSSEGQDDVDSVCTLDLAKVWKLVEGSEQSETQKEAEKGIREVLDLVNYLLYVRNRELEHQNGLSEAMGRLEKQLERKTHVVQTLTAELETLKQNYAQQKNLFKAKEQTLLSERKTLQTEKKALEVNCARLQGVETAYKAQVRRKDVDYARLRKSLQDSVARSAKEKRGMAIAKTLNGVRERKQASAPSQSNESKLTKKIMENLERKKAELLFDNEVLSKNYDSLQRQLESLTSQYKKAVQLFLAQKNLEGDAAELEKLASAPIDDFTPTPFNLATKQGLPNYISESMEVLDGKLKQLEHVILNEMPSAEARSDKEVMRRLREKLDDAHVIIKEQDQLLQASLSSPAMNLRVDRGKSGQNLALKARGQFAVRKLNDPTDDSPAANSLEELEREKRELAVIRKNLENERQLLQERAVKLDKDRLEFEIAKQEQMFGSSQDSLQSSTRGRLPSTADSSSCSTPKRKRRAKVLDMSAPDSPFDIPVSATPGTAALLKKIGITVPTEK